MDIGVWGDSITYGAGDREGLGWVGRLRKHLFEQDREVYNRGISGDTSTDVLKRFAIEAAAISPAITVFAVGMNDSKLVDATEHRVPLPLFAENVRELITRARAKRVILIGLTDVKEGGIKSRSVFRNAAIAEYDACLKELARREQVDFIPLRGVLDCDTDLADGLHPNGSGYEKMFRTIAPFVS